MKCVLLMRIFSIITVHMSMIKSSEIATKSLTTILKEILSVIFDLWKNTSSWFIVIFKKDMKVNCLSRKCFHRRFLLSQKILVSRTSWERFHPISTGRPLMIFLNHLGDFLIWHLANIPIWHPGDVLKWYPGEVAI